MAILSVTVRGGTVAPAGSGGTVDAALAASLKSLPEAAPIVILIHGYRFDPADPAHDPHRLIFAPAPARASWKLPSWPGGLGFAGGAAAQGLCIGFGWPARAGHMRTLLASGRTGFAEVYHRAGALGGALAGLIEAIAERAPGRPIDILAHSLGARVAVAAMPHLSSRGGRALGRMILLGGAEFAGRAEAAFTAAPDTAQPEVYSVTARHNDLYDALFERFAPRGKGADHALARGMPRLRNWLSLQIDHPRVRAWAASYGIRLEAPDRRICHWGFYTLPGAMTLYAHILRERAVWSVAALRGTPALEEQEPRWARLRPLPRPPRLGAPRPLSRRARGL
ncbi:MAG TPA: alpha/beta hydrolase [Paracoccaceae bacterium]|nr:alpha/beta hydrolase [Paracoccaceae bacterium]